MGKRKRDREEYERSRYLTKKDRKMEKKKRKDGEVLYGEGGC